MTDRQATIIGAGLAGSEAAWQLVSRGIPVRLHEMRPDNMTKAHCSGFFAELVCSNSFRGAALTNAVGLLKKELSLCESLIMEAALASEVPAGGALAVDRELFAQYIDEKLRSHPLVTVETGVVEHIPEVSLIQPVIIATGPLTAAPLAAAIQGLTGESSLAFYDAISPIILGESIDHSKIFRASRYGKGGDDYLNIPLSKDEYYQFIHEVDAAEKFTGHEEVESDTADTLKPFEGCMPIEDMVQRGQDTPLFGPLKPVGLLNPLTGNQPYAVIQLRQDDKAGQLWSMVGLQTRMKHPEQRRIFRSLPGLESAEFVRLGSVHRNTFIDSPKCLSATLEFRATPGLFFAGQITGTEGYVESTAGGLIAGWNASRLLRGESSASFPVDSAMGALAAYISDPDRKDFQPMNINFGLMPSYFETRKVNGRRLSKPDRRLATAERALSSLSSFLTDSGFQEQIAVP